MEGFIFQRGYIGKNIHYKKEFHSPESNGNSSFGAVEQNWWVLERYDKIKKCRKKSEVSMWNIFMYLGPDLGPHHSSVFKWQTQKFEKS